MSAEFDSAWYGTFKVTLDTPVPTGDSSYWPPDIYVSPTPRVFSFKDQRVLCQHDQSSQVSRC